MASEPDIVLYYAPQSRSIIAHWMLEELGQPYRLQPLNLKKEDHKQPSYLAINPMGKVPSITHKGVAISEVAAICCFLADVYPEAGLAVPAGDKRRGPYLKWLFFGPSCLEPAIVDRMFKRPDAAASSLGYGSFDATLDVVAKAVAAGPYLLGEKFTAADVVIGSNLIWGAMTQTVPERPAFSAYTGRLQARPALQRVYAKDAELVAAQAA
ncbi:MAG TPA: glutathione S-transferase family protein [Vineibacter sp.]|nr:glutathione S-transferase family protein [Vineibacter sp.]